MSKVPDSSSQEGRNYAMSVFTDNRLFYKQLLY